MSANEVLCSPALGEGVAVTVILVLDDSGYEDGVCAKYEVCTRK